MPIRKAPDVKECSRCGRTLPQEKFDYNPHSPDTLADVCTTDKMLKKNSDLDAASLDNILSVVYTEAAAETGSVLKRRGEFEQKVAKKIQKLNLNIKMPRWIHRSSLAE